MADTTNAFRLHVESGDVRDLVSEILAFGGIALVRKNGDELEVRAQLIEIIDFCAESDFEGRFRYEML